MRQFIIRMLCSAAFLAAVGCNNNAPDNNAANEAAGQGALLPHYTVAAGPVTGNRASGIDASFRITQASPPGNPADGIPSDLLGGGCIVFRVQDLNFHLVTAKSCTQDADCETTEKSAHYCQHGTGQCWARPEMPRGEDPLCNRSVDYSPPTKQWPVDTDVRVSKNANAISVASYNLEPNSQALAIACLRGKGAKSGCGDKNSIVKWGQPTTIP